VGVGDEVEPGNVPVELARVGRLVAGDVGVGDALNTPCWRFWTLHFVARGPAAETGRTVRGARRRTSAECRNIWYMGIVYNGEENKGRNGGVVQVALRLVAPLNPASASFFLDRFLFGSTSNASMALGHKTQTQRMVNSLNQAGRDRRARPGADHEAQPSSQANERWRVESRSVWKRG